MPLTLNQGAAGLGVAPRTAKRHLEPWGFRVGRNLRYADNAIEEFKRLHAAKPRSASAPLITNEDAETRLAKVFPGSAVLTNMK